MKLNETIKTVEPGGMLEVTATDPGFVSDSEAWCKKTGNKFIKSEKRKTEFAIVIQKAGSEDQPAKNMMVNKDDSSMVVFSGDFDKAIAAFIIANGALAMGKKVTMFFTFWGLNVLRKPESIHVKKNFIEKMFGFMMPRGSSKLKLSNMNMAGMGPVMIKKIMKDKNVNSLEVLMQSAIDGGAKIVACTMSMDLMGIKKEELIDGIEYGGVAAYLGAADESNHNLFI
jgi:peroxiredoxin family protein/TusA-related sulfurtransferase